MTVFGNGPFRRRVTLRTILAEQLNVNVLGGMAGHTIQHRFFGGEA